ncbi:MAG TPA: hypothetical protein DDW55_04375 [Gammaproteobacteria bacterium]|nr:hypothetical protein [Gammaproteobacteria bacterium]
MKYEDKTRNETSQYEYRLKEEIHFWRRMIDECRINDREHERPRMQEALALAEFRLLQFNEVKEKPTHH